VWLGSYQLPLHLKPSVWCLIWLAGGEEVACKNKQEDWNPIVGPREEPNVLSDETKTKTLETNVFAGCFAQQHQDWGGKPLYFRRKAFKPGAFGGVLPEIRPMETVLHGTATGFGNAASAKALSGTRMAGHVFIASNKSGCSSDSI
jgi:hypothetical protein